MNENAVIAVVVLVALFGCACGWLYSLRWRSEVRERLFEADATVRIRRLERRATPPRRTREEKSRGRLPTASRPPKAKSAPKNKNRESKAGTGSGKKQLQKQKQEPEQQSWCPDNQQDWSSSNQQDTQENTEPESLDQNNDQNQESDLSSREWVDPAQQSEDNQSTSTTPAPIASAIENEWGSANATSADESSGPDSSAPAGESESNLPAGSTSGWSADGNSSSAQGDWGSNVSGGEGWGPAEKREDDHPETKPDSEW